MVNETTMASGWFPAQVPQRKVFEGRFVRLEPLDAARHGDQLWTALQADHNPDPLIYRYFLHEPFSNCAKFKTYLETIAAAGDPMFFASVIDRKSGEAQGYLSMMSIVPKFGSIEIGWIANGACMQRTPKSTEAFFLVADEAFKLGYRRLEWQCNNENERSKSAALRFGFTFEGVFRQHRWAKGGNWETAWFSLLDGEWPSRRQAFVDWLNEENFDERGRQKHTLKARHGQS